MFSGNDCHVKWHRLLLVWIWVNQAGRCAALQFPHLWVPTPDCQALPGTGPPGVQEPASHQRLVKAAHSAAWASWLRVDVAGCHGIVPHFPLKTPLPTLSEELSPGSVTLIRWTLGSKARPGDCGSPAQDLALLTLSPLVLVGHAGWCRRPSWGSTLPGIF